ncbi:MAG TPA: hypothetical protein DEA96_07380 [Leptospiraceae bacterium]|nr:hypothetical protein [Spirochaetaceae bacterium]HBS04767.1 hypothetical protein [Leptospiraceae bacterium]|tara:strand:+ start:3883 stop:5199 length:1317 start_codon:yes stop_codon:yes gene_type:complete
MIKRSAHNHHLKMWLFSFAVLFLFTSNFRKGADLQQHIDLAPTYVSAHLLWAGKGNSIYDNSAYGNKRSPEWVEFERDQLMGHAAETTYIYLPAYLILVSPIALLTTFAQFKTIFLLLKIPFLAWFLASMACRWPGTLKGGAIVVGIFCLSDSVFDGFRLGQNVEFLAVLVPAYFYASAHNKNSSASLFLLLSVIVKPWAAVLLFYPASSLRIRQASIQASALLALIATQWLLLPEAMSDFVRLVSDHNKISILSYNNLSLDAFLHKLSFRDWMQHFGWNPAPNHPAMLSGILRFAVTLSLGAIALLCRVGKYRRLAVLLIPPVYMNIFWNHYLLLYFPFFLDSIRIVWGRPIFRGIVGATILITLWADAEATRWLINGVILRGLSLDQLSIVLPFIHFLGVTLLLLLLINGLRRQWSKECMRSAPFLWHELTKNRKS